MRRLTRGQAFELAFWALFALGAMALTFQFNRDIEIYRFGASGWPRGIIVLIVLAALGQLWQDLKSRDAVEQTAETSATTGAAQYLRLGSILGLPVIYAWLLQPLGFYFLTPLFIVAFLLLGGERRVSRIVGVTLFLYVVFVLLFAKLLYVGLPTGNVHPFYDFSNWLLVKLR